ncbi:MAG: hypothetical protein QNL65_00745 [Opitutales bacterium]|nr:hypothetical protein [Opitutales bacterium]
MWRILSKPVRKSGRQLYGNFVSKKGTSSAVASQKILDKLSVYHTTENKKKK